MDGSDHQVVARSVGAAGNEDIFVEEFNVVNRILIVFIAS
jgi:hypothetical protein